MTLDELAASVVGYFPPLDLLEQRLSLDLYRLLAEGQPVPRTTLAERLEISIETVNRILDGWPGVFSDAQRRIVGYWGLSIRAAYSGPHRLMMNGRTLSAWCAWDTLFLPQLVGHTAEIESASPVAGGIVRLTVTPEQVVRVEPVSAHMSLLLPGAQEVQKYVLSSFCHFVYFFPSPQAGESWVAQHAGTFMLSTHEAHVLARLKNEAQYREVLRWSKEIFDEQEGRRIQPARVSILRQGERVSFTEQDRLHRPKTLLRIKRRSPNWRS